MGYHHTAFLKNISKKNVSDAVSLTSFYLLFLVLLLEAKKKLK